MVEGVVTLLTEVTLGVQFVLTEIDLAVDRWQPPSGSTRIAPNIPELTWWSIAGTAQW